MLAQAEKEMTKRIYSALRNASTGFRPRAQQLSLIGAAARALGDDAIAMVEAPTGTGKTFGYLIPGMSLALSRGKRLVVSTATAALQDQVAKNDMPVMARLFAQETGQEISYVVAKGRERYICPVRLEDATRSQDMFEGGDVKVLHALHDTYASGEWDGQRDSLKERIPYGTWSVVNNNRHMCTGRKCPQYGECPFYVNNAAVAEANVVIVNHDLLLRMIAKSENSPLADFSKNFYVFDEAHHLPKKAVGVFASTFSTDTSWLFEAPTLIASSLAGEAKKAVNLDVQMVSARMASLRVAMSSYAQGKVSKIIRFPMGQIPANIEREAESVQIILERLLSRLESASEKQDLGRMDEIARVSHMRLASMVGKVAEMVEAWASFFGQDDKKPRARWAERDDDQWRLSVSPFDAAPMLRHHLWENTRGAVLTSATLSSCGSMKTMQYLLGLPDEKLEIMQLDSPFDMSRARLCIPRMRSLPDDAVGHTDEVANYIAPCIDQEEGGVLVLFASAKQMREVHGRMGDRQSVILMQGDASIREIVSRHRERIREGKRSVIFGLASFAEGIDLPGNLCTRVIIAKIPFPSPDEPIVAAHAEWLEKHGKNAFALLSIPEASIRLAQAVGRLLRTEDDYGEVDILDRRLLDKSYGRRMVNGLKIRLST